MTTQITHQQLQQRLTENADLVLAEALPEKYYRDWHLPGAVHLPHDQVRALAPTRLPPKDNEIVVYCASATCQNSHIAARILGQMGYTNVAVYAGGKEDWVRAGLPVERSSTATAD